LATLESPRFATLQNYAASQAPIVIPFLDVMILAGRDLPTERLDRRKELPIEKIFSRLGDPIPRSPAWPDTLDDLIQSVRAQGLEGPFPPIGRTPNKVSPDSLGTERNVHSGRIKQGGDGDLEPSWVLQATAR
jgi:hypothetical protein